MAAPTINPNYVDADFIAEAEQIGGSMWFTAGAKKLGFNDPRDREQIARFMAHLSPTGERLMRWQANSPEYLYCPMPSVTASVNAWLKSESEENYSKFMTNVMKFATQLYLDTIESRCYVRETVDGVQRSTKAELVGLVGLHGFTRDGNASAHTHPMFWRWGVTEDGSVKSFEDRRFVPRMMQTASENFHLAIAVGLKDEFGFEPSIVKGKCEIPGIPKQALDSVGTRRKEMFDYLEKNNIKPTPGAMAYAAINTRKEKKAYSLSERITAWNRESGKVDLSGLSSAEPSRWGARLKAMIDEYIVQPAKVIHVAYKRTWGKHPGTVKVRDVTALLEDTRKRTRKEGHRAAIRALYRTNLKGLNHALKVAEAGYKQGRKPTLQLPVGARVVVSAEAARNATPKQLEELKARANQNGWVLRIAGQSLTGGMSQSP